MQLPQRRGDALRFGLFWGALVAGVNFAIRILPGLASARVPLSIAIAGTIATFIMFGGLAFGLAAGGGQVREDGKIEVRAWFAWLFLGAIVAFIVGAVAGGTDDGRWGVVAAVGWIVVILSGRAVFVRFQRHGGATP